MEIFFEHSSGNTKGMEDTHPRLKTGFFRTQPMVYDTSHEPARNEIQYMLSNCQRCIDENDNSWAFMLRQLVDVFIIMAFDKLKAKEEDLTLTAQCEGMVPEFEGAITTLHLREDFASVLLTPFHGLQLPSQFHDYVNSVRERTPVTAKMSWAQWLKEHHNKCLDYNPQQCKNLYFGHWLLNTAKIITADIKNIFNPLWQPLEIPSGKSITDMIRAIRFHVEKIKKYSNLIAAYRRREEYKTNVWDTEEKRLKYVDTVAENLEINFTSTTYSPGFLAFLVCSHPIDFYMRRRMSLPLCVPPMTIEEEEVEDSLDRGDEGGPSTAGISSFVFIFFEYNIFYFCSRFDHFQVYA